MPKLKDIPNLLIKKREHITSVGGNVVKDINLMIDNYNSAISEQGEKSITINREKLARIMWEHDTVRRIEATWPWEEEEQKWYLEKADSIIKNQAYLFEVEE